MKYISTLAVVSPKFSISNPNTFSFLSLYGILSKSISIFFSFVVNNTHFVLMEIILYSKEVSSVIILILIGNKLWLNLKPKTMLEWGPMMCKYSSSWDISWGCSFVISFFVYIGYILILGNWLIWLWSQLA